ncbi:MAG TPA: hypothetical protein VLH38_05930 [Patescibacteria group bacterium]|nr:hypothetical protein [Patescibacteria group bacterium]
MKLRQYLIFILPLLFVALVTALAIAGARGGSVPEQIWLPESAKQSSDQESVHKLPVASKTVTTKYGHALRFASTDSRTTVYEFRSNSSLQPSKCPNISEIEEVLPSGCDTSDTFQGRPVYNISRRLPSGTVEYFVTVGNTFIFIKEGGDGDRNLVYLKTFTQLRSAQISGYIDANRVRIEHIQAAERAEKAATEKTNAQAYTKLDFTPAMPKTLPAGWRLNTQDPIHIDGPDANHPRLVNAEYINNTGVSSFVSFYAMKRAGFTLGTSCGPSPGNSMQTVYCHKPIGTNYYEASWYDGQNRLMRYLYYPVGDSVVITSIEVMPHGNAPAVYPTDLANAQTAITLNAVPTNVASLTGSVYKSVFYR